MHMHMCMYMYVHMHEHALFSQPVFLDSSDLVDLRSLFTEGVLVCGLRGAVMVRRSGDNLTLEGSICEEYFAVRELLYGQYHAIHCHALAR